MSCCSTEGACSTATATATEPVPATVTTGAEPAEQARRVAVDDADPDPRLADRA